MNQEQTSKNRLLFLDVLRIIAVSLVVYTHLFSCAMDANVLKNIVSGNDLPIFSMNFMYCFENFLQKFLHTNPASIGVALFFIITGYLMPMMMERYARVEFLINRILRIFPTMIVATIIIGVFLYFLQNITFSSSEYVSSWFLINYITHKTMITGVLWTLVVEVIFYFSCFLIGKFTLTKLLCFQIFILLTVLYGHWHVFPLCKFTMCILVGSAIYLSQHFNSIKKYSIILLSLVFYIVAFRLAAHFEHYQNYHYMISTHVIVILLFLSIQYIFERFNVKDLSQEVIKNLSELVYSIYLTHCSIGLAMLDRLRDYSVPIILNYLLTVLLIAFCSFLLYKFVETPSINLAKKIITKLRMRNVKCQIKRCF